MIRTIIVEDEPYSREHLEILINDFCSKVELVGQAGDVSSGFDLIKKMKPDLVLLDIEMPDGTGFELLQKFPEINFEIIFTTAFAEYAVQAFRYSAIHYLLKPIDPEELVLAIDKAEEELRRKNIDERINAFFHNMQNQSGNTQKLVLASGSNIFVVSTSEIIMCKADKNYTHFFIEDGRDIIVAHTIKEYEKLLSNDGFLRVHRQYLVNIDHVKSLNKANGGEIYLSGNMKVPVTMRKKDLMKLLMGKSK
jgi:two-component system LytT family response regulator